MLGFFSLASLALRACETRALRAHKTLTPRFTDFFTDFEKKNPTVLQSIYQLEDGSLICRQASCNHYPITDQNMGFSKSLPNCQTRFQRAQKRSLLQTKTAKNDLCLIPNQTMVPNTKAVPFLAAKPI